MTEVKENRKEFDEKESAKIIDSMNDDQKQYLYFVLRQIDLGTDFAKWFKAFRIMNWEQKTVFNKKVSEAIRKKDARDKDYS